MFEQSKNINKIGCKCLILCGSEDKSNSKSAYSFHDQIKNSRLKIIDGAGQEVNTDKPQELADVLSEFWKASTHL